MAARPRDYVRVAGPDAEAFLQRMLSNDVATAPCRALLLTPKSRVIAPVVILRRAGDDFLLLTEPGLGDAVASTLVRARFAAKVEIEPEEHSSVVVFGEQEGIPNPEFGEASSELLDADVEPTLSAEDGSLLFIEVPGGYDADTTYTLTIGTGLTDKFGGALPATITITFTTAAA